MLSLTGPEIYTRVPSALKVSPKGDVSSVKKYASTYDAVVISYGVESESSATASLLSPVKYTLVPSSFIANAFGKSSSPPM